MTDYDILYEAFFDRIERDAKFFSYNGVTASEALTLAKTRAKKYLVESVGLMKLKCSLDIDIQLDDDLEQINVDLTSTEIFLISSLMYEVYLSRDIVLLKTAMNVLSSSDIKMLYAPANERKTFMDMYRSVQEYNLNLIDDYNSRDRVTGAHKVIDYSQYGL